MRLYSEKTSMITVLDRKDTYHHAVLEGHGTVRRQKPFPSRNQFYGLSCAQLYCPFLVKCDDNHLFHRMYPVKALQCRHLSLKSIQILCRGIADLHSGTYIRNIKINLDIFRGNIIFIFTV